MAVTQEGFRWRNDDGSETTATWLAAQDTNASLALATNARLRTVIDTTADVTITPKLYYKKSTDSTWLPVAVGSGGGDPVYVATSSNIAAGGEPTTALLTAPSGKTTADFSVGRMWDDENGSDAVAIAAAPVGPVVFTDDFNRTNTSSPGLGSNWTGPNWHITSNKAVHDSSGNEFATALTDLGSADHYSQVDVIGQTGGNYSAVTVRGAGDNSANCYVGFFDANNSWFTIGKFVSGSFTSLNTGGSLSPPFTGTIRLEAEGTTLRLYVGGTLRVTASGDSTFTTQSYAGLYCNTDTSTFDNFSAAALPSVGSFTPASLTGLLGWWKSDSAGNTTAQWNDSSGNSRHGTQSTSTYRPTLGTETLNGMSVYSFDSTSTTPHFDYTVGSAFFTGTTASVSFVMKNTDADGWGTRTSFSARNTGAWDYSADGFAVEMAHGSNIGPPVGAFHNGVIAGMPSYSAQHMSTWCVVTAVFDPNVRLFVGGVEASSITTSSGTGVSGSAATGTFSINDIRIGYNCGFSPGGAADYSWQGAIAEIVWWGSAVTADRINVETYLARKWGL
jgi:hypothetical protein